MKKIAIIILGVGVLCSAICYGIDLYQGEVANIYIEVEDRDGATFTIQTANYAVYDLAGYNLQSEATASIDDSEIYGLVNTTTTPFSDIKYAQVKFVFIINSETRIYYVPLVIYDMSE